MTKDDLRKEIRSLIWKAFVDARVKTLRKRERVSRLRKQEEITTEEVTRAEEGLWNAIRQVTGECKNLVNDLKLTADEKIRALMDRLDAMEGSDDVNEIRRLAEECNNLLSELVEDLNKLINPLKSKLGEFQSLEEIGAGGVGG
ncbi:MAG: hypothetical protein QW687_00700 [Candidatus Hadarchaeales archaeon]